MPTPNHTPMSSRHTIPPRLTVPPFPPQLYRRLLLTIERDGLLLRPQHLAAGQEEDEARTDNAGGVMIKWGVKGAVQPWSEGGGQGVGRDEEEDEGVVVGGILGIVRLWDAAYLLVFLLPTKQPFPLFPSHATPSQADNDPRKASASTHHVYTLQDVHAIPLLPEFAQKSLAYLSKLEGKRRPRRRRNTLKSKTPWNLGIPLFGGIRGAGAVSQDEGRGLADSSSSDSDGSESDASESDHEGPPAPEADETPEPIPTDIATAGDPRSRFRRSWGRLMSKSKVPQLQQSQSSPAKEPEPTSKSEVKDGRVPTAETVDATSTPEPVNTSTTTPPFASDPPQRRELETKILKQIISEFSAGTFFYSLDFDLTHTLQHKRQLISSRSATGTALADLLTSETSTFPPSPTESTTPGTPSRHAKTASMSSMDKDDFSEPDVQVPLWRRADRRFFWNEWLCREFIELGLHGFIIPVMQGWVQSASFNVPVPPNPLEPNVSLGDVPIDIGVISRRSRDRAGLRYQRRGIDDQGHVANMVETEMIVRAKVEGKVSLFSFVQVRGSIPLKWSQSPYSMKPPPVLDQPVDKTYSIANLHFNDITTRYGPITIVNLSEQTGKEGIVTNGYRDLVKELNRKDVIYKDFDFHAKCHGMNWENISELVAELDFGKMGYLWTLQGDAIREQKGAFRTNCIDCLDRTNVVQSALARHVLSQMLTQLGLIVDPNTSAVESVFNDVWANNGDTISLCYAHTSALKGDFVRTGKRDLHGMLHDGVSSLSRMFYGAVSDFFAQAVISFFLGHRNLGVFSEFLQNLQSSDASSLIQLSRVRGAAIETSSARVLSDGEHRVAGWTLLSPEDRNTRLSPKLEEKVLLLTKKAIYVVSFNYSLEKVIGFTRIPLESITSIQKGAYILSTLQEAGRDPMENSGFVINFSPQDEQTRYSTYSIRNKVQESAGANASASPAHTTPPSTPLPSIEHADINPLSIEYYAFKVLPREFITRGASTVNDDDLDDADISEVGDTCRAVTDRAVRRIRDQCAKISEVSDDFVIDKDVVSLSEAQQSTSLLARVDYAVKRFLWL